MQTGSTHGYLRASRGFLMERIIKGNRHFVPVPFLTRWIFELISDDLPKAVGLFHNTGNAKSKIGVIGFKLAGVQCFPGGFPSEQIIADGIGLIAVGYEQLVAGLTNRMVNDEDGIRRLGGIVRLGRNTAFGNGEHVAAGGFAAGHNEISGDCVFIVGGAVQNNAATGGRAAFPLLGRIQRLRSRSFAYFNNFFRSL